MHLFRLLVCSRHFAFQLTVDEFIVTDRRSKGMGKRENCTHEITKGAPGARFSKVPKLLGPISGAPIPFTSSQRQGFKPLNLAILLAFLTLKTCSKISFSKQADCSSTTGFPGPKSALDFRQTEPRSEGKKNPFVHRSPS